MYSYLPSNHASLMYGNRAGIWEIYEVELVFEKEMTLEPLFKTRELVFGKR